eukprot:jgi/Botrbrau1/11260/Bobra.0038s0032.1
MLGWCIRQPRLFSMNRDLPRSGIRPVFTVGMIKSDQGNPQTPALIQTYNLSLIFWVKDIVCENSAAIAGGSRLCRTYTRFNVSLGLKVRMGSVLPPLPTRTWV